MHQDNPYAAYQAWLADKWSINNLASIVETRGKNKGQKLYTVEAINKLADMYGALDNYTNLVGLSLRSSLSTVLQPYLPPQPAKIGIYFRDWPVPCADDSNTALKPEECGKAVVQSDIMSKSIGYVLENEKPRKTLSNGLHAAHDIVKYVYPGQFDCKYESFVRGCVVGDLVKIQALFCSYTGKPFPQALSKSSCHTTSMYEFAGSCLADELNKLDLHLVVGFGAKYCWDSALDNLERHGWCVHIPTNGKGHLEEGKLPNTLHKGRHFVLLPHPVPRNIAANRKAVSVATGVCNQNDVHETQIRHSRAKVVEHKELVLSKQDGWFNGNGSWRKDAVVLAVRKWVETHYPEMKIRERQITAKKPLAFCRLGRGRNGMINFLTITGKTQTALVLALAIRPSVETKGDQRLANFNPTTIDDAPHNLQLRIPLPLTNVGATLDRIKKFIDLAWNNVGP